MKMMGYPEEQIAQLQQFNLLQRPVMAWSSLAFTMPFVGYLLYVRKFFTRRAPSESK